MNVQASKVKPGHPSEGEEGRPGDANGIAQDRTCGKTTAGLRRTHAHIRMLVHSHTDTHVLTRMYAHASKRTRIFTQAQTRVHLSSKPGHCLMTWMKHGKRKEHAAGES